jgi:hypothetical protein
MHSELCIFRCLYVALYYARLKSFRTEGDVGTLWQEPAYACQDMLVSCTQQNLFFFYH